MMAHICKADRARGGEHMLTLLFIARQEASSWCFPSLVSVLLSLMPHTWVTLLFQVFQSIEEQLLKQPVALVSQDKQLLLCVKDCRPNSLESESQSGYTFKTCCQNLYYLSHTRAFNWYAYICSLAKALKKEQGGPYWAWSEEENGLAKLQRRFTSCILNIQIKAPLSHGEVQAVVRRQYALPKAGLKLIDWGRLWIKFTAVRSFKSLATSLTWLSFFLAAWPQGSCS